MYGIRRKHFQTRLNELGDAFTICGYHKSIIERGFKMVERKPRLLDYNRRERCDEMIVPWIVTYGLKKQNIHPEGVNCSRTIHNLEGNESQNHGLLS